MTATLLPQTSCVIVDQVGRLLNKPWCVYEHQLHDPATGAFTVIMVGSCPLAEVYQMVDPQRNSEWLKQVTPLSYLYIKITQTGERMDCQRDAIRHMRTFKPMPICNLKGIDHYGKSRVIVAPDGREFTTQQECALAFGLNQGQLSKHLNNGSTHVRGMVFKYKDMTA